MGTGKSTVGKALAKKLGLEFIDTDDEIERSQEMSIPDIFEKKGEPFFRAIEERMIRSLEALGPAIISCGGGSVLSKRNVASLRRHALIILLTADLSLIKRRLSASADRPLLTSGRDKRIETLWKEREHAYLKAADIVIDTTALSPPEVVSAILRLQNS